MCFPAEVHALLLSDAVVLLQEKDQKLVFAAVVSSPQICSLPVFLHVLSFRSVHPLTKLVVELLLCCFCSFRTINHPSSPLRG